MQKHKPIIFEYVQRSEISDTALNFEKAKIGVNFQKSQDKSMKKSRKAKNRLKKPTAREKSQRSVSL